MNTYSIRLALAGLLIGFLTLTAAAVGPIHPQTGGSGHSAPQSPETTVQPDRAGPLQLQPASETQSPTAESGESLASASLQPAYYVALRAAPALVGTAVTLSDPDGHILGVYSPDADGDAALGPICPGRYLLSDGRTPLGEFVLEENASVCLATDRLWADGELLHLECRRPGEIVLELTLDEPGYYSLAVMDQTGEVTVRDLFISSRQKPQQGRSYLRTLRFPGLMAGAYTVLWNERTLCTLALDEGGLSSISLHLSRDTEGK